MRKIMSKELGTLRLSWAPISLETTGAIPQRRACTDEPRSGHFVGRGSPRSTLGRSWAGGFPDCNSSMEI